ncbi:MAG TPA: D-glycerate dehydrogenase [Candidatus Limnocylindrales bacterium]|nr:D-glycerate dehydrogenase [Candidatus Limnocylindrales bacterium]
MTARVFVTRVIPSIGLDIVRAAAEAEVWPEELPPPRDVLLDRVRGMDGLLCLLTDRVDDELLDAAGPQLRVVSNFAVGYDNIDVPACTRRGVAVGNTPGVLTETTADLAFALLMAVARRLPEARDYVREDRWRTWGPMLLLGKDLHGATLGLVGFGRIGREMARRATGFGMRTLYHDVVRAEPDVERVLGATHAPLETVLAESDFVSLHTVLSAETRHLIDAAALARMKRGAILINTSRGPVVDGEALADALRSGHLFGAGLDVTDPEPLRAEDPLVQLPNCLVVPHIASASERTRDRMAEKAARNLVAGLRGEPLPDPVTG